MRDTTVNTLRSSTSEIVVGRLVETDAVHDIEPFVGLHNSKERRSPAFSYKHNTANPHLDSSATFILVQSLLRQIRAVICPGGAGKILF